MPIKPDPKRWKWKRVQPGIQVLIDEQGKQVGQVVKMAHCGRWLSYTDDEFPCLEEGFDTAWEAKALVLETLQEAPP